MFSLFAISCGGADTPDSADKAPAAKTTTKAPAAKAPATIANVAGTTPTPVPKAQPVSTHNQAKAKPAGKYGGTIPMQVSGNVAHWDIMKCGSGGTCMSPTSPIYNGLVHYNGETAEPLDIRGDLATGWTLSEDGMSYVFSLPEDARWHDGTPITADDVVYSLDEMVRDDVPRPRSGQIRPYYKSSKALNPHSVQVDLKFQASAFLPFLATEFMKMWPKHHAGTGVDMGMEQNILGSGPFKMVEHTKDVGYKYVKNEDYFK